MIAGSPSLLFPGSSIHPLGSLESSLWCYIDAAVSQKWEERAEGGNNVLVHVTTVVNYDIQSTHFFHQSTKEIGIVLASPEYFNPTFLKLFLVIDIQRIDQAFRKIIFPHSERCSARIGVFISSHANFQYTKFLSSQVPKMFFIMGDVPMALPFVCLMYSGKRGKIMASRNSAIFPNSL